MTAYRQTNDELLGRKIILINNLISQFALNRDEVLIHREGGQSSYQGTKVQLEDKVLKLQVVDPVMKKRIYDQMFFCWTIINRILTTSQKHHDC